MNTAKSKVTHIGNEQQLFAMNTLSNYELMTTVISNEERLNLETLNSIRKSIILQNTHSFI